MGTYIERIWAPERDNLLSNKDRKPGRYLAFVPDELTPNIPTIGNEAEAAASAALSALVRADERLAQSAKGLNYLLVRSESISSSWIEGNRITPKKLAIAEALKTGSRVALDVIANIRATEQAIEQLCSPDREITVEDIIDLHQTVDPNLPRGIRQVQNFVGGKGWSPLRADFVPPPETEVERLLDNLAKFISAEGGNPVIRAAIAHAQFETIHPFEDGNGRTGRALIQTVLKRSSATANTLIPISAVFASKADSYIAGLTAFRLGASGLEEWIIAFSEAAAQAAELAVDFALNVDIVDKSNHEAYLTYRSNLGKSPVQPRRGSLVSRILEALPANPVLTNNSIAEKFATTRQAANLAILELVDAGILKINKDQHGKQSCYSADSYLALVDSKF